HRAPDPLGQDDDRRDHHRGSGELFGALENPHHLRAGEGRRPGVACLHREAVPDAGGRAAGSAGELIAGEPRGAVDAQYSDFAGAASAAAPAWRPSGLPFTVADMKLPPGVPSFIGCIFNTILSPGFIVSL